MAYIGGSGVSDKEMNKVLSNDDKCTKKVKQNAVSWTDLAWVMEESLMMPAEQRHDWQEAGSHARGYGREFQD